MANTLTNIIVTMVIAVSIVLFILVSCALIGTARWEGEYHIKVVDINGEIIKDFSGYSGSNLPNVSGDGILIWWDKDGRRCYYNIVPGESVSIIKLTD